jgi:translation initiation factor 4A
LYKHLSISQAVIFCNKRSKAEYLAEKLGAQGFPITCVHGELEKNERAQRIKEFFEGATRVLIATDMLARGIDCQQLSLVINYELSSNMENYVHRIGRAGRFGRKGTTINLILPEEEPIMQDICKLYGMQVNELPADLSKLIL